MSAQEDTSLPVISLVRLLSESTRPSETSRLFTAGSSVGFFYLSLDPTNDDCSDGAPTMALARTLSEAGQILLLTKTLFSLSVKEKKAFDVSSNDGYFG